MTYITVCLESRNRDSDSEFTCHFNNTSSNQPIYENSFLLAVPPYSAHRLLVGGRVPVRLNIIVKQNNHHKAVKKSREK